MTSFNSRQFEQDRKDPAIADLHVSGRCPGSVGARTRCRGRRSSLAYWRTWPTATARSGCGRAGLSGRRVFAGRAGRVVMLSGMNLVEKWTPFTRVRRAVRALQLRWRRHLAAGNGLQERAVDPRVRAERGTNASVMDTSVAAAERDAAALLVTEWGATNDPETLTSTGDEFDARLVPWLYWSYNGHVVAEKVPSYSGVLAGLATAWRTASMSTTSSLRAASSPAIFARRASAS